MKTFSRIFRQIKACIALVPLVLAIACEENPQKPIDSTEAARYTSRDSIMHFFDTLDQKHYHNLDFKYQAAIQDTSTPGLDSLGFTYYGPNHIHPDSVVIVFFHGGGFQGGHPGQVFKYCSAFAKYGYYCLAPEYTLGAVEGQDTLSALLDARAFMQQLDTLAKIYRMPRQNWVSAGISAGGALAARIPSDLALLYSPVIKTIGASAYTNQTLEISQIAQSIDVLNAINQGETPSPSLVFHGNADQTVDLSGSQEYCEALEAAEVDCQLEVLLGQGHNDIIEDSAQVRSNIIESILYLQDYFGAGVGAP